MIHVYPKHTRYSQDHGWLQSNFSFSFGDYFDENNSKFGPMRVCNDDTVAPRRGFGAHPHADMEIVSVVLSGKLRHEDSLGNVAVTGFGEVQRMTAGTGVIHTEANPSDDEPVNLLQMWFEPERRGLPPSYETSAFDVDALREGLVPIVSRDGGAGVARIHQDMTIYLSRLPAGESLEFLQERDRRAFLFVIEGSMYVANAADPTETAALAARDTARITETPDLKLTAAGGGESFFLLIDLP
ncbi:pirin family protein [Paenibacillus sp.]|uniref:pirin family protein n=1 Tax=Paenibacillus sp. TaxID=58172 RepID=UPI002D3FAC79|nr:pirin family protein [Paenibacillus sp.]HZG83344.1 pirin family protein [Paenibacillus sp.]